MTGRRLIPTINHIVTSQTPMRRVNDTVDSPDSMDVERTTNPRVDYQYVMIDERSFCSDG